MSSPASPALVCLTFDNLGEAADLGDGSWPADAPIGQHFTVEIVHRLLGLLDRLSLPATYFVEAYNAGLYPEVLQRFTQSGREVGCHAWQHEPWHRLAPTDERELLTRCTDALRGAGVEPVGFRPPGGQITSRTEALLGELGYRYYSPAGLRAGTSAGLAVIPFDWRYIDPFYLAPVFSDLRRHYGVPEEVQPPARLAEAFIAEVHRRAGTGEQLTLLFHPMLLSSPGAFAAMESVLEAIAGLRDDQRVEPVLMRDFAAQILADPEAYGSPVGETVTWN